MGLDLAFFAAPDDEAALEAERRAGGPFGWSCVTGHRKSGLFRKEPIVTELGPAFVASLRAATTPSSAWQRWKNS
jgi:hypothetical protein